MRTLVITVLLGASALLLSGLGGYGDRPSETYITAKVERGSISSNIKATGTVNAVVMVDVGSQLSGQISEVLVTFNDPVKAGQVIAKVNPETYIGAVREAAAVLKIAKATAQLQRAALEKAKVATDNTRTARRVAEAELKAAQAQQEEAERNYERNLKLVKTTAIPDREFTQSRALRDASAASLHALREGLTMKDEAIAIADAELAMAESNLASAEAVVEQKEAALEQAKVDLQRTQIRSPIDGTVIKRTITSGQTVAVSLESKTLFKIANDLSEMEVHGKIDEADIGQVKVGQPVTFTVDAYPEMVFSGRVLQVRKSPDVSQNVVTYTAVISAPNPDHLLFPGMTARLQIVVTEIENALKIPNPALRFRPNNGSASTKQATRVSSESGTVWVVSGAGTATAVPVILGRSDESGTQVVSGELSDTDRVIIGLGSAPEPKRLFGIW